MLLLFDNALKLQAQIANAINQKYTEFQTRRCQEVIVHVRTNTAKINQSLHKLQNVITPLNSIG